MAKKLRLKVRVVMGTVGCHHTSCLVMKEIQKGGEGGGGV